MAWWNFVGKGYVLVDEPNGMDNTSGAHWVFSRFLRRHALKARVTIITIVALLGFAGFKAQPFQRGLRRTGGPGIAQQISVDEATYSPIKTLSYKKNEAINARARAAGWKDNLFVEWKRDPAAGGFLYKNRGGTWDVWPRRDGKSYENYAGLGYKGSTREMTSANKCVAYQDGQTWDHPHEYEVGLKFKADHNCGSIAQNVDPKDWDVVNFPVGPVPGPHGWPDTDKDWDRVWFHGTGPRKAGETLSGMVGKSFLFTIKDLGKVGCGFNANYYAIGPNDHCDAQAVPGDYCEEIDFFEANRYGWQSTVHLMKEPGKYTGYESADHLGWASGFGGTKRILPNWPAFSKTEYGPSGTVIDTDQDIHVAVSFPNNTDGRLKGMSVELWQDASKDPLYMHFYGYSGSTPEGGDAKDGMKQFDKLMRGSVPTRSSIWQGDESWLDSGPSKGRDYYEGLCPNKCIPGSKMCPKMHEGVIFSILNQQIVSLQNH